MERKVSVVGLGYVGLPVAVAFAKRGYPVVGFDIDKNRIEELRQGIDKTLEVANDDLKRNTLFFTDDPNELASADFHIVTIPTPINDTNQPDLIPLVKASETIGRVLKKGDIVVYESTVFPGATEEICVPILERESNLTFGQDFTVGYSPERLNPGDKEHCFEMIKKVVSGSDQKTLDIVSKAYSSVVTAGVHEAPSLKTAEAAKVIENVQRDLNIALMNELSLIFKRLNIDTKEVLEAAGTKWNFLKFFPGLVGGHCISVDPYYLTHKAEQVGYNPEVILAGRRINDHMGGYVASQTVKHLVKSKVQAPYRIAVLGITFKENVPDCRNSQIPNIINELVDLGIEVLIHDPFLDQGLVNYKGQGCYTDFDNLTNCDAVIVGVSHDFYKQKGWPAFEKILKNSKGFIADLKGFLDKSKKPNDITLWRL